MRLPPYCVVSMPLCRSDRGQPRVLMPAEIAEGAPDFAKDHVLRVLERLREEEHGSTFRLPSLDPGDWNLVRQGDLASGEPTYTIEPL